MLVITSDYSAYRTALSTRCPTFKTRFFGLAMAQGLFFVSGLLSCWIPFGVSRILKIRVFRPFAFVDRHIGFSPSKFWPPAGMPGIVSRPYLYDQSVYQRTPQIVLQ